MEDKTATQLMLEKEQKELKSRTFKHILSNKMKSRLNEVMQAYYLHVGMHGRVQNLNQELSKERAKLRDEMIELRDIISNINRGTVLMTEMKLTFAIQDQGNVVLDFIDEEILDILK